MAEETLRLVVRGRVQGVGFRWFVVDEARRLNLAGWVRNNADGSVEVCARGPATALHSLDAHVRRGPSGAHVSQVDHVEGKAGGELPTPFSILRG